MQHRSKAITKFPFASHVSEDTDKEMEDNELVGTAVVQPLVE